MLYKIDDDYITSVELQELTSPATQRSCGSSQAELCRADSFDHCNDLDGLVLREDSFDCCQVIMPEPAAAAAPATATTAGTAAAKLQLPVASHPIHGSIASTQGTCRSEQPSPSPTFSHASSHAASQASSQHAGSQAACHDSEQHGQQQGQQQQNQQQGQQQQLQQEGRQEVQEVFSGEEEYEEEQEGAQSDDSERFSDVGDPSATEVVFVKEGVAVWPSRHERIMGRLSLVKQHCVTFLAWLPYAHAAPAAAGPAGRAGSSEQRSGRGTNGGTYDRGGSAGSSDAGRQCSGELIGEVGDMDEEAELLGEDEQLLQEPLSDGARTASPPAGAGTAASTSSSSCSTGGCPTHPQPTKQAPKPLHQAPSPQAVAAAAAAAAAAVHSGNVSTYERSGAGAEPSVSTAPHQQHQQARKQGQQQQQQQAYPAPPLASGDRTMYAIHPIPLSDIAAITRHTPLAGWHYIVVVLVSGLTLPPLFFHNGGVRELIRCLKSHAFLVRASQDPNTYLVNDTADPLQRSLTSLELSDILLGAPAPGATSTCAPASYSAAAGHLGSNGHSSCPGPGSGYPGYSGGSLGSVGGFGAGGWDGSDAPWRGLSQQLGDTLSKVTAFARESASTLISAVESWHNEQFLERVAGAGCSGVEAADALLGGDGSFFTQLQQPLQATPHGLQCVRHDGGYVQQGVHSVQQGVHSVQQGVQSVQHGVQCMEQGLQCMEHGGAVPAAARPQHQQGMQQEQQRQESEASTSVGTFELLDGEACGQDRIAPSRARIRPPPLSAEEMGTYFNAEGVLVDMAGFKKRVFYSGIEPELRKEAWPFLLGVHPPGATAAERARLAAQRRERYAAIKGQWQSIGEDQARRFAKWRERKGRIEKDVRRTDRSHPFYSGKDQSPNLRTLRDILCSYAMFNFDLGYCQGMSDLASPLLYVCRDEAEAFWCFAALMERLERNFHTDQNGMHAQLLALKRLVQVLDPQLHAFFDARDCTNYFFTFRWLLIHFKREFPFDEVLRLWEALWSANGHLTPHLHLYLAVAVLVHHRRAILADPHADFDCMLKLCVQLGGRLELDGMLRLAESLCVYAGEAGREALAGLP